MLAIVPARGGSKGIRNKNIVEIEGKPLIQYTLDEAKASKYIDRIYISTDSQEIAETCEKLGFIVSQLRPPNLATDYTKIIEVIMYILKQLNKLNEYYDYIVLLQPTQPLRKSKQIDEAIELIYEKKAESLVSLSPVIDHPILIRRVGQNNQVFPLLSGGSTVRRQDFPLYYIVNGAIYINSVSNLTIDTSLNDNQIGYLMDRSYHLDIDEHSDLETLKRMLKQKNKGI
ncbi:acylneuraminate cytidylyltransferase family protein [Lysinibacillus sp. 1P01SD]|uniref:acylneuraminate cytidylyltransferase family protein n=1 Tax=Lysinibacillus sp. 1P01SD TaxID=3132285 RepID=UPI0039A20BB8